MNLNVSARTEFECPSQASILSWVKGLFILLIRIVILGDCLKLSCFCFVFFPLFIISTLREKNDFKWSIISQEAGTPISNLWERQLDLSKFLTNRHF